MLNPPTTFPKPPLALSTPIFYIFKSQPTQNDPSLLAELNQSQDKEGDVKMDDSDDDDLLDFIEEQRAKVFEILSIGPEKPKTILGLSLGKHIASSIHEAVYYQLVFIHPANFKLPDGENEEILELFDQAVYSK